jgi:hypothetical protein
VVIVYHATQLLEKTIGENSTGHWTEKLVILMTVNVFSAVFLGLGIWRNKWAREQFHFKKFDNVFIRVIEILGTLNMLIAFLTYHGYNTTASYLTPVIMIPLILTSGYGYARMFKNWASKKI